MIRYTSCTDSAMRPVSGHVLPSKHSATDTGQSELTGSVQLGQQEYNWSWWDGQQLRKHFVLDTETGPITGQEIPRLAMVSVSDGLHHYVMLPRELPSFLLQHLPYAHHMICHNVAFDFWVMSDYLADTAAAEAQNWLWSAVDRDRVHDTMLLAGLVSLAERDTVCQPGLADAAKLYCDIELEKDTYRTRYAETIGADWTRLDPGFFKYAVSDAIATYQLYCKLTAAANQLTKQADANRAFGFLTEAIQVKAAISLADITRRGMYLDLDKAGELREGVDQSVQESIAALQELVGPGLFHRYKKTGELIINKKSHLPQKNMTVLTDHLEAVAVDIGIDPLTTPTGKTTTSVNKFWYQFRGNHPLIEAYCSYTEVTKLRTFLNDLADPVIHPLYKTFVRSGRTSCRSPSIQQLPRGSGVREVVIARPGHLLLIIDYSAIELRTLAAVCYSRYGFSKLGDIIKAGTDPHAYTAAMFAGVGLDQFHQLPDAKHLRQQAKAINFGFPGGLGAATLVSTAKRGYGVEITEEKANEFRTKLIEEVYPELKLYLSEDSATILARTLQAEASLVRALWSKPSHLGALKKVVDGNPFKKDGTPYSEDFVDRVWRQLARTNNNPEFADAVATRDTSDTSPLRRLMFTPVMTPTGRIRGGVSFTAARNTPFQGLAADGAKLAMWELLKAGYQVIAFVHDEFVIELDKLDDCTARAVDIDRICCEAMQQLVGDIPVTAEYALAERWYKQAEPVFDGGRLQVWRPT